MIYNKLCEISEFFHYKIFVLLVYLQNFQFQASSAKEKSSSTNSVDGNENMHVQPEVQRNCPAQLALQTTISVLEKELNALHCVRDSFDSEEVSKKIKKKRKELEDAKSDLKRKQDAAIYSKKYREVKKNKL